MPSTLLFADDPLIAQEIRYHTTEASEVFLLWGIDDWNVVSEEIRPPGTIVKEGVMHNLIIREGDSVIAQIALSFSSMSTDDLLIPKSRVEPIVKEHLMYTPMAREGDSFIARIQIPFAAMLDYGFLMTKNLEGVDLIRPAWDGYQGYQMLAFEDGIVEVQSTLTLEDNQVPARVIDAPLVTQEICYHRPDTDEVVFVWGLDGWYAVPEEIRPTGTIVKEGLMYTPMVQTGNTFVAKVQVPISTTIDYGFLITKPHNGADIKSTWDYGQDNQILVLGNGVFEIETMPTLAQEQVFTRIDVLVPQEIRYHMPEAGEVFLVWGIDGWKVVSEEIRPSGTKIEDSVMHTPMLRDGDTFVARVQVPFAAKIGYGFLITKNRDGADLVKSGWDGDQEYQIIVLENGIIELRSTLSIHDEVVVRIVDAPLVSQNIRYHMPEAGEVYLVWGIDGWYAVPEEIRPTGTSVKKGLMHTPMVQSGDTFVANVQVPAGAMIEYGFLITKNRKGGDIKTVWDGHEDYQIGALEDSIINVEATVTLTQD